MPNLTPYEFKLLLALGIIALMAVLGGLGILLAYTLTQPKKGVRSRDLGLSRPFRYKAPSFKRKMGETPTLSEEDGGRRRR